MQRVQLTAFGEPPDVFDLETLPGEPDPDPEEVLVAMEAAPSTCSTPPCITACRWEPETCPRAISRGCSSTG
jgi:hypothetical protein